MITLYQIKPKFVALLRPIASRWVAKKISANQVTLLALLGSVIVGSLLTYLVKYSLMWMLLLPIWMFIRMALNAIDGIIAKEHNQKTALGAYLNELADVISDIFVLLPFIFISPFSIYSIGVVILLSIISEFAGVLAHSIQVARRYDGPIGKSDRALIFGALALWVGMNLPLSPHMWIFPWIISMLIILNCFNRINKALQLNKEKTVP